MRIVIIGTGNAATVLGRLLHYAGHEITQVIGRNAERTEKLAGILNSSFTVQTDEVTYEADIYLIAVADNSIEEITHALRLDKKLVVHTAGSIQKDVLRNCSKNYGVLYPLQSLRKEMDRLPQIPFLIDGNTPDNCTLIADLARTISSRVEFADDKRRLLTHLAAVMVSNFTNHLYMAAEDLCKHENISFQLLLPLIEEVADRLQSYSPQQVQTGPAIRNDTITIQKHIALLKSYPLQQSLYGFITDSIRHWHGVASG